MKLAKIIFTSRSHLPHMPAQDNYAFDVTKPPDAMQGWRMSIVGPNVVFVSPPGWSLTNLYKLGKCGPQKTSDGKFIAGPREVRPLPLDSMRLVFEANTEVDKDGNVDEKAFTKAVESAFRSGFTSAPFGAPLPEPEGEEEPRPGSLAAQLRKPIPAHERGDD